MCEVRKGSRSSGNAKQFHCYLVQKIESVFHRAKLACGANYPVGWVQMPHSVSGGGDRDGGAQRAIED